MSVISLDEAGTQLGHLLDRAVAGEDIVIARAGKPVARLVPVEPRASRRPGLAKGRLTDAFFEPLPPDELDAWPVTSYIVAQ